VHRRSGQGACMIMRHTHHQKELSTKQIMHLHQMTAHAA
jgi:hypothetical protein